MFAQIASDLPLTTTPGRQLEMASDGSLNARFLATALVIADSTEAQLREYKVRIDGRPEEQSIDKAELLARAADGHDLSPIASR